MSQLWALSRTCASLILTRPFLGMRADMSWSTLTPESRTTHRLLFYFWISWYHDTWQG